MLTLGGYREANWCENVVYVFDLSGMAWTDTYYPNTPYIVPPQISTIIGGTSQGGATVTSPEAGWDPNVEAVFRSQNSSNPSPSSSPSPSASPSPKSKSHTPAILGGVLGGLLGIAAVLTAILLYLRRRRQRKAASEQSKPAALSEVVPDVQSPQYLDGRSSWNPPQELYSEEIHTGVGHQRGEGPR